MTSKILPDAVSIKDTLEFISFVSENVKEELVCQNCFSYVLLQDDCFRRCNFLFCHVMGLCCNKFWRLCGQRSCKEKETDDATIVPFTFVRARLFRNIKIKLQINDTGLQCLLSFWIGWLYHFFSKKKFAVILVGSLFGAQMNHMQIMSGIEENYVIEEIQGIFQIFCHTHELVRIVLFILISVHCIPRCI